MMDCNTAKQLLDADGAVDSKKAQSLTAHLRECESCRARVAEEATLRNALRHAYQDVKAPDSTRAQVLERIRTAPTAPKVGGGSQRRFSWKAPLSIAASIMLAVVLWAQWPASEGPVVDTPADVVRLVAADVRTLHLACVRRSSKGHHAADLPRDLHLIAEQLGEEFGLEVEAPNLEAEGFTFLGADRCRFRGKAGAHILYGSDSKKTVLSLLTVARIDEIQAPGSNPSFKHPYIVNVDQAPKVVLWSLGLETHAICADLPRDDLEAMVDRIRLAQADDLDVVRYALNGALGPNR